MHSCAELTCARRPTRVEAWPILLWDVAQQATEHHGVAWVSKTTAQRSGSRAYLRPLGLAARQPRWLGIGLQTTHRCTAPREPGRQCTISSSPAVPCLLHFTAASARARTTSPASTTPASRQEQKHRPAREPRSLARVAACCMHQMERYAADETVGGRRKGPASRLATGRLHSNSSHVMHG
jgi:hypothetical protein